MELKERLVQLRKDHGLSQNDLAEKLNVSRQAISRWEQGTVVPSSDNLVYLSKLYGITLDELFYGRIQVKQELNEADEREKSEEATDILRAPYNKAQQMKKVILIMLCILLIGIVVGIMVILSSRSEILPIQNLEREQVNISEMEDISNNMLRE